VVGDDASDPQQAKAVANKLVSDGVLLVVGHRASDMTRAAAPIYADAGIIQITPSSTNPELTERGFDNFFRVCGRDDIQALLASEYLQRAWEGKAIGIIHDNSTYGQGLARLTRDKLNEAGVSEVLFKAFEPGKLDYGDLLDEIRRRQVDPRTRPEARSLVERFRADGYEPEGYTLHTYAAIQVWAAAVEKAGKFDREAVAGVMRQTEFDTVLGKISFDHKGDLVQHAYAWYRWQLGKISFDHKGDLVQHAYAWYRWQQGKPVRQ
jgi:branched-chain amino acid transport system substrate-binding protein